MTNNQINKLGKRILESKESINQDDLILLQEFRTSFSNSIIETFKSINEIVLKINNTSITAFRLKRISTIINKVERNPKMQLSRMGDIAGIRCIFSHKKEVYKALDEIKNTYKITGKINDYYQNPKDIGYKGIHIYIKDNLNKRVEIQLRTIKEHNWATLVEITDLLYGTRLKEIGWNSNPKLAEFHSLISSDKELTHKEANFIYDIVDKYDFISKLNQTFLKNNKDVKDKWHKQDKKNTFFLIEVSKNNKPNLKSFYSLSLAEEEYFKRYQENPEIQIVLTSIRTPNFKQISIAYANYILSYHNFINDIQPIIRELSKEFLERKEYFRFIKLFKTYEELQAGQMLGVLMDVFDILPINRLTKRDKAKLEKELRKKTNRIYSSQILYLKNLKNIYPKKSLIFNFFLKKFIEKHTKRINKKMKQKIKNLVQFIEKDKSKI